MGAFGELLQQHFGGTKHDVSTWHKKQVKKKTLKCEKCGKFAKLLAYNTHTHKYECSLHQ